MNVVERIIEEDGKLHILRSQDVQAIVDGNKVLADISPSMVGRAKWRLAGRIPSVIIEQWSRECGAKLGSEEFKQYIRRKLADGDFAAFRVKGF